MKSILTIICCTLAITASAQKPKNYFVEFKTDKGVLFAKLYNETPLHRDNFKKLSSKKYFDGVLFHRVIKNFMIQGGDPDSKTAKPYAQLGNGGPGYAVNAEIQEGLIHRKGALGAAREGDDVNPAKKSSGSQFYIVQGRKFSQAGLDSLETFRMKGKKLSNQQRDIYSTVGGTPHLDGNYTVFGEVVKGLEAVDNIAAVKTDNFDRPITDEKMYVRLLKRREASNLERELEGLSPKNGFFTKLFDIFKSSNYKVK